MHRLHLSALTQPRVAVKLGVTVAVVSTVAANRDKLHLQFRPRLNSTVIEAISGAAGEVAQIALVYPLDTVKVRCQAAGIGSGQVVAGLWAATQGHWPTFLAALYAGALPAAALSVLVGAVHYVCFCTTRRAVASLTGADRSSGRSSSSGQQELSGQQQHHQHVIVSHGATGTHFLPIDESPLCGSDSDPQQQQQQQQTSDKQQQHADPRSSSRRGRSRSSKAAAVAGDADVSEEAESVQVAKGSLLVNCVAAVITAAITALVESPLELFRHNSQAGQIQGNFLREMWRGLRKSGPRSLYYGFGVYCLESVPYDITELLVVGAARDMRQHQHPAVRDLAPIMFDLGVGGVAGAVAVLVSMPFDVIKTYIQTHGAIGAAVSSSGSSGAGLSHSMGLFLSTAKALVARGGPQALFVGLVPRLAHQVPGAIVCWYCIETCHRTLTKHCHKHRTLPAADSQATLLS